MAAEQETDDSPSVVKTYIPSDQKKLWQRDAEAMDMSQSEFVRSMVQAGRRGFELGDEEASGHSAEPTEPPSDSDAPDRGLESAIVDALERNDHLSWDELLAVLTDDIEERLDDTLQELQAANSVQYSGRNGGYTLADDE